MKISIVLFVTHRSSIYLRHQETGTVKIHPVDLGIRWYYCLDVLQPPWCAGVLVTLHPLLLFLEEVALMSSTCCSFQVSVE